MRGADLVVHVGVHMERLVVVVNLGRLEEVTEGISVQVMLLSGSLFRLSRDAVEARFQITAGCFSHCAHFLLIRLRNVR